MEHLEFNKVLDGYLTTGHMSAEDYEMCDDLQKNVIQELKKAFKRINQREVETIHHSLQ
jgi:hypothetical protein